MPAHQPETCQRIEYARPKINLTLRIAGRRSDGYHELVSLVVFAASVGDRLTLDPAAAAGITVSGPFAAAIQGENLLHRVLGHVTPHLAGRSAGHVTLEKNLPVAAGIGGGSADAAALLRALRAAYPAETAALDLSRLALRLGADVPVCLDSRAVWMSGIGETLHPVEGLAGLHMVLVNPCVPVPADKTARVFRALGAAPLPAGWTPSPPGRLPRETRALCGLLAGEANDLTAAASSVMPVVAEVLAVIGATTGCLLARLSGAGPTSFGLYESASAARSAASEISRARPAWWVRATTAE